MHCVQGQYSTLRWCNFVKGPETRGSALKRSRALRQHSRENYSKVFKQRKRRVRELESNAGWVHESAQEA